MLERVPTLRYRQKMKLLILLLTTVGTCAMKEPPDPTKKDELVRRNQDMTLKLIQVKAELKKLEEEGSVVYPEADNEVPIDINWRRYSRRYYWRHDKERAPSPAGSPEEQIEHLVDQKELIETELDEIMKKLDELHDLEDAAKMIAGVHLSRPDPPKPGHCSRGTDPPRPDPPMPDPPNPDPPKHDSPSWWFGTNGGRVTLSVLIMLGVCLLFGLTYTAYRMCKRTEEPIEYDIENPAPLDGPIEIVIDPPVPAPPEEMVVRAKHWRRMNEDEYIGRGSYGSVFVAWSDDLGTTFAVKEIVLDDYLRGDEDTITETMHAKRNELLGRITNELRLLRDLKHPNILQHFGEEISITKKRLYIFTELMSAGTIQDRLDKGTVIPNKLVARYGNDILAGLRYLHELEPAVVHRDIKPTNLLIDKTGRIKLADFGTVKILDRFNEDNSCRFPAGTYMFAPPEMHRRGKITPAFDVWSLAVTLHMMVTGRCPWPKEVTRKGIPPFLMWLTKRLATEGVKLDHPILLANPQADLLTDMILRMLAVRPEDRPMIAEIQQFSFFKNYDTTHTTNTKSPIAIDKLTELRSKEDWRLTETQTVDPFDECKLPAETELRSDQDRMPEEKTDTEDGSIVIEYGSTRELPPVLEYYGGDNGDNKSYSTDYDER